ncbi:hypothetical protein ABZ864_41685 [Streptomyces sp. NPDC047082]|uniref:hypothetical protein n=1 Tax=Streptomyces sp. NPDC047082 TaxID=3155259 RepID=UPI0033F781E6
MAVVAAAKAPSLGKSIRIGITIGLLSVLVGLLAAWQTTSYITEHASDREEVFGKWPHSAHLHAGRVTVYSEDSIPLSRIRITAPDGTLMHLRDFRDSWVFAGSMAQVPSIAVFSAPEAGVYTYQTSNSVKDGTGLVVYQTKTTVHRSIPGVLIGFIVALPGVIAATVRIRRALRKPPAPPAPLPGPPAPQGPQPWYSAPPSPHPPPWLQR